MKHSLLAAGLLMIAGLCSCGTQSGESPLMPVAQKLDMELAQMGEDNVLFLGKTQALYEPEAKEFKVTIEYVDSLVDVQQISEAMMQFYTAMQLKNSPGTQLDTFLNTMSKEEGNFKLEVSDVYGHSRTYTMSGARLKQLFKLPPMQLDFQDVKANVVEILASRCPDYMKAVNAADATFEISGGFATYTLSFEKATAFSNMTQGSLKGRYLHVLQPRYEAMGQFAPEIQEFLKTLGIEGYRFVYKTIDGKGKDLKVAIPWRDL